MKITMVQEGLIPFGADDVLKSLGMPPEHRFAEAISILLEKTKDIAKPKAFYLEYPIEKRTEKTVSFAGMHFHSDGLARNVKDTATIYPFLCTCGGELAAYAETLTDFAEVFAFDAIMDFYRKLMTFRVKEEIRKELPEGLVPRTDYPGSLWGWEVRDLKKLFALYGSAAGEIGVSLSEYYLMTPLKTLAGVAYGVPEEEKECALCSAENCSRREVAYSHKACLASLYRI